MSWNNNLAENAIKRIGACREDVGRSVKEAEACGTLGIAKGYLPTAIQSLRRGDNKLSEAAVAGRADCPVAEDQDLPILNPFRGTPTAFLALVSRSAGAS